MVQISTPTLLSLLVASAAAADLRAAHRGLHRRGDTLSVASYPSTFQMTSLPPSSQPAPSSAPYPSQPAPAESETSCTDESTAPAPESTPNQPYPQGSSPAGSTPAESTPAGSTPYPQGSSPPAESTPAGSTPYPQGSSPAGSTPAESTPAGSTPYPEGSSPAGSTPAAGSTPSYPEGSSPAASSPAESTPAGGSPYPVGSSPAGSIPASSGGSYPESSPAAGQTSTKYETSYSTAYTTVTGGSPSGSSPQECGTVTVTVTAGQSYSAMSSAPASSAPASSAPQPAESSEAYPTKPSPVANSYSKAGAQNYQASSKPKPKPASGGSTGKRGVAYNGNVDLGGSKNVHWAHNWGPSPGGCPEGVDYVPMCKDTSMEGQFKQAASSAKYLMSFNEVDMTQGGGGTAMSPQQAASSYKQIMMPYAGTHSLGAPSITSHNATGDNLNGVSAASGLAYLKQFAEACTDCQVDFACLHWYGGGEDASTQAENFKNYMTSAISTVKSLWPNAKVWVDEFSATPTIDKDSSGVNKQFMDAVLPWLDQQNDVERYSYFAATPGLMTNPDGSLTDIGKTYAS